MRLIKRGHIASRSSGLVRRGKLSKTVMSRKLLRVCRQMPSVRNRLRWASKAPIPTCRLPLARRRRISNISRQTTRTAGITGRHTSTKTQTLKAGRRISTTLLAVRLTRLGFRIRKGAGNVLAQLGNLLRRDRLDGYSSRCLGRVGVKTAPHQSSNASYCSTRRSVASRQLCDACEPTVIGSRGDREDQIERSDSAGRSLRKPTNSIFDLQSRISGRRSY